MVLCLPFSLPDATPIGDRYAMQTRDGITYYFFNLEPFDCHPADDRRAMLLRAAKLQPSRHHGCLQHLPSHPRARRQTLP